MGPKNGGHYRQVVAIRRWSLTQVWLQFKSKVFANLRIFIHTLSKKCSKHDRPTKRKVGRLICLLGFHQSNFRAKNLNEKIAILFVKILRLKKSKPFIIHRRRRFHARKRRGMNSRCTTYTQSVSGFRLNIRKSIPCRQLWILGHFWPFLKWATFFGGSWIIGSLAWA